MPSKTVDVPEGADVSIKNNGGEVTVSWSSEEPVIVFEADGYEFVIPASEDFEIECRGPSHTYEFRAKFDREYDLKDKRANENAGDEYNSNFLFTDFHVDTMHV